MLMSKERLEEIKNSHLRGIHSLFGTPWVSMPKENFDWLIEQAERVEELEIQLSINTNNMKQLQTEKDEWKDTAKTYYMTNQELREQNKRYREALEEILEEAYEEAGIHPDTGMQLETFIVKTARQALEGEEE